MSASALVRLHQNPGPFPPSTLYGIYGRSSPPLTMAVTCTELESSSSAGHTGIVYLLLGTNTCSLNTCQVGRHIC
ncbi:hypothetical protein QBC32DRAFT_331567 [Pseudoneurospora amorphoporcata]|uniref:Uncharacterized protein n=1 Tax=Pseudoneurospora amorphoporcata TaxID=241081 RepID=A0AAN6P5R2_9PEZI|nr:hypothetical protein QBC32DRAFT_331567 [Pseudoneurospora amorphoporcata]